MASISSNGDPLAETLEPEGLAVTFGTSEKVKVEAEETLYLVGQTVINTLPQDVYVLEETPGFVDLSGVMFFSLGNPNSVVGVELTTRSGTLDADAGDGVTVTGGGTDTLLFQGRLRDIIDYLQDSEVLTYTGAKDVFGARADSIGVAAELRGGRFDLGSFNVEIEDVSDDFEGTDADDIVLGENGRNVITGLNGDDSLEGFAGDDVVLGGAGNDTIAGGAGADTLDGGADEDVLYFVTSRSGVNVDLNEDALGFQMAWGGEANGDVITGFEHVYGSNWADGITGNAGRNILFGYAGDDLLLGMDGDDVIRGGHGADTMDGGAGRDWVRYVGSNQGVRVDLNPGLDGFQQASGGDAEGDVLSNFEDIQGSEHDDELTGDGLGNYILGFEGDDLIVGGAGNDTIRGGTGADTMDGGVGDDLLQYIDAGGAVSVDLNADVSGVQSASGAGATGDVISGFEHVHGGAHDDLLVGNGVRNTLYGNGGRDTLNGGDGKDVLRGGADEDSFVFDSVVNAGNFDRIIDFTPGEDEIVLDSAVFAGLSAGTLAATQFVANATGLAETAEHRVIYDTGTGWLYFDADGTGAADGVRFADLSSLPAIGVDDFTIV